MGREQGTIGCGKILAEIGGGRMREFLFKGKRKDWRELPKEEWWVEGYIVKHGDRWWIYTGKMEYIYYPMLADKPEKIEVDPETVCQYTGFNDKKRREIFENDIVKIYINQYESWLAVVKFGEYESDGKQHIGVYLDFKDKVLLRKDFLYWYKYWDIEVIGNVFDNLELLEVQE